MTFKWELDWESHNIDAPDLIAAVLKFFPSDDVANRLFDLFFRHTNTYLPLLHRPTFERQWQNQLHHSNIWFATVCILMFAVASRWYAVGEDSPTSPGEDWKAVGWRWFFVALDVHCIRPTLSCPATLFEIQTFVVSCSIGFSTLRDLTENVAHGILLAWNDLWPRGLVVCFNRYQKSPRSRSSPQESL